MAELDALDILFIAAAFVFQIVLIVHFALRRWRFATAIRYGPLVYALGIPAALVSVIILAGGRPWHFWLAGFLYLVWAGYGWFLEYRKNQQDWRTPFRASVGVPYVLLYLAVTMFYWFPLLRIWKPLFYVFGILYLASTYLNVTSHKPAPAAGRS